MSGQNLIPDVWAKLEIHLEENYIKKKAFYLIPDVLKTRT